MRTKLGCRSRITDDVMRITNHVARIMNDVMKNTNNVTKITDDVMKNTNDVMMNTNDVITITNDVTRITMSVRTITRSVPTITMSVRTITRSVPTITMSVQTITRSVRRGGRWNLVGNCRTSNTGSNRSNLADQQTDRRSHGVESAQRGDVPNLVVKKRREADLRSPLLFG